MALINVPLATQSLGQTNASIRANWNSIVASYEVDHVAFNSLTNTGFHNKITFPVQAGPLVPPANTFVLYEALDNLVPPNGTNTGVNQLFLKKDTDPVGSLGTPITAKDFDGVSNKGWTMLPSGVIIKWGRFTYTSGIQSVGMAGPAYTSATSFSVTVTSTNTLAPFSAANNGTNAFNFFCNTAGNVYTFMAVGV